MLATSTSSRPCRADHGGGRKTAAQAALAAIPTAPLTRPRPLRAGHRRAACLRWEALGDRLRELLCCMSIRGVAWQRPHVDAKSAQNRPQIGSRSPDRPPFDPESSRNPSQIDPRATPDQPPPRADGPQIDRAIAKERPEVRSVRVVRNLHPKWALRARTGAAGAGLCKDSEFAGCAQSGDSFEQTCGPGLRTSGRSSAIPASIWGLHGPTLRRLRPSSGISIWACLLGQHWPRTTPGSTLRHPHTSGRLLLVA